MDGDIGPVLAEQLSYYRARAPIYDKTYKRVGPYDRGRAANQAWKAELARIADRLAEVEIGGHLLELGCGTGYWTELLASRADRITAIDGAPEMIEMARTRLGHLDTVDLQVQELIDAWSPDADCYDGVAAFFFIEHVPDQRLDVLLRRIAHCLRPGAAIVLAEGAGGDEPGTQVETRELGERWYRVVERRRSPSDLAAAFDRAGMTLTVEPTGRRFIVGTGHRRP